MDLPIELWKHEIYPSLDYDSRINLNRSLPPEMRGNKKFSAKQIRGHSVFAVYHEVFTKLSSIVFEPLDEYRRVEKIKDLFRLFLKPLFEPILYITPLREQLLKKCDDFYESSILDLDDRQELNELCNTVKQKLAGFKNATYDSAPISLSYMF